MAVEPISALPTKTTVDNNDYIPIVDVSTNTTKKITKATLGANLTSLTGFNALGYTPTFVSNNGNKEVVVQVSGVDLTAFISAGFKLAVTRSTTAPTQSMAFVAASSQYASKASPTGITFTSAFTCEAWVYLNSYSNGTIESRYDGTNGWAFQITSSGQLQIGYFGTGQTQWTSYQSLPLKRWVHVAASVSSVTSKTLGGIYINGTLVTSSNNLSTQTALTQSGSLQVGAANGLSLIDGYISEARVWSQAQTQIQIQNNMCLSLTTATGLVFNAPGNGSFNDVSGNANNLTSFNGAIATQLSNPANNIEYAIVTKVAYSAPNTTLTLFSGTDYNIPNMALSNPQYSTARTPYGFPASRGKWIADTLILNDVSSSGTVSGTWYGGDKATLSVPTGEWNLSGQATVFINVAASNSTISNYALSTSSSSSTDRRLNKWQYHQSNVSSIAQGTDWYVSAPIVNTIQTTYYGIASCGATGGTVGFRGDTGASFVITAECAYI